MFPGALMSQKPSEEEIRSLLEMENFNKEHSNRTLTFRINKDTVDRYGSVLSLNGWKLDNYRENPVFLYQHNNACFSDSVQMPVGRSLKEWSVLPEYRTDKQYLRKNPLDPNIDDGTGLYQLVYFPEEKNSEAVLRGFNSKLLNAVSAGFNPYERLAADKLTDEDKKHLGNPTSFLSIKQELIESSAVSIPGNTQAKAIRSALESGYPAEFLEILELKDVTERFGDIRSAVETVNNAMEVVLGLSRKLESIEQTNLTNKESLNIQLKNLETMFVENRKLIIEYHKSTKVRSGDQLPISDEFYSKLNALNNKLSKE